MLPVCWTGWLTPGVRVAISWWCLTCVIFLSESFLEELPWLPSSHSQPSWWMIYAGTSPRGLLLRNWNLFHLLQRVSPMGRAKVLLDLTVVPIGWNSQFWLLLLFLLVRCSALWEAVLKTPDNWNYIWRWTFGHNYNLQTKDYHSRLWKKWKRRVLEVLFSQSFCIFGLVPLLIAGPDCYAQWLQAVGRNLYASLHKMETLLK